jgi:hypothetical protein
MEDILNNILFSFIHIVGLGCAHSEEDICNRERLTREIILMQVVEGVMVGI